MSEGYSQQTPRYAIPVLGYGDAVLPEVELAKWQTVENLIAACMKGESSAVFREGELSLVRRDDGIYAVMNAKGGIYLRGMSDGVFFEAARPVEWGPMRRGGTYYLYVVLNSSTHRDPSKFKAGFSQFSPSSEKYAIVASVDLRGDEYKIDTYPAGKVNPLALDLHVRDNDNPHGEDLTQKNLRVTNRLDAAVATVGMVNAERLVVGGCELVAEPGRLLTQTAEIRVPTGGAMFKLKNCAIKFAQMLNPHPETKLSVTGGTLLISNGGEEFTETFVVHFAKG